MSRFHQENQDSWKSCRLPQLRSGFLVCYSSNIGSSGSWVLVWASLISLILIVVFVTTPGLSWFPCYHMWYTSLSQIIEISYIQDEGTASVTNSNLNLGRYVTIINWLEGLGLEPATTQRPGLPFPLTMSSHDLDSDRSETSATLSVNRRSSFNGMNL
jgi:hypothetical protein